MGKSQSYQNRNRGMRRLLTTLAYVTSFANNIYNYMFHNNRRNSGKAGGHLHTGYSSGGGSGHYNMPKAESLVKIEKKRRRKEVQKSQRINRKRAARICSFK